jgi:zinc D-Ala-D-Ala carboxypeptidase
MTRCFYDKNSYDPRRKLSPNFTLGELVKSHTAVKVGLPNMPREDSELANLRALSVELLEPVRLLLGVPLVVTSGFRSVTLNRLVGGAKESQHILGEAADIVPKGIAVEEAAFLLSAQDQLRFDQIIYEIRERKRGQPMRWLHLSHRRVEENRHELLTIHTGGKARKTLSGIVPYAEVIT